MLREEPERELRRQRLRALLRPRACVRRRQQPAEICVTGRRLDEQRDMRAARERDLGACDRAHAERLGGIGELERAVDPVVIGQRERVVAELGGPRGELFRLGGSVEERVG